MKSNQSTSRLDPQHLSSFILNAEKRNVQTRHSSIPERMSYPSASKTSPDKWNVNEVDHLSEDEKTILHDKSETRISRKLSEKDIVKLKTNTELLSNDSDLSSARSEYVYGLDVEDDRFANTGSTFNSGKTKMTKAELRESRRQATLRLADKRKEMNLLALQRSELKRQECTLHRVKWRANAKGKRTKELDRQVDSFILRDVILNNPSALAFAAQHDFDCISGKFSDESVWGNLLTGLELHPSNNHMNMETEGDTLSPHISEYILNTVGLPSGTKLTRSKFEMDDSIGRLPKTRSFIQKTCLPSSSKYFGSTNLPVSEDLNINESNENAVLSLQDLSNLCADDILDQQRLRTLQDTTLFKRSRSNSGEITPRSESRKKLNLFAKFVPPDKKRPVLEDRGLMGEILLGLNSSSPSGVSANGSGGDDGGEGIHSVRLADSVFLVGPSEEDIEKLVQKFIDDNGEEVTPKSNASLCTSEKSHLSLGMLYIFVYTDIHMQI